jgi:hypothetical protein
MYLPGTMLVDGGGTPTPYNPVSAFSDPNLTAQLSGTTVDTTTLSGILAASGSNGGTSSSTQTTSSSSTNVSSYTQPVSAPTSVLDVGTVNPDDPHNSAAFKAKYGRVPTSQDFQAWRISQIPPQPTTAPGPHQHYRYYPQTGWKLYWDVGYGPGPWGSALLNSNNSLGDILVSSNMGGSSVIDTNTGSSYLMAGNGGAASIQENSSIITNTQDTPQPPSAIPAPVYALDTPENLYIDPNSFNPSVITESVHIGTSTSTTDFSSTVYSADLKFDSVDGAIKYNYRISATI